MEHRHEPDLGKAIGFFSPFWCNAMSWSRKIISVMQDWQRASPLGLWASENVARLPVPLTILLKLAYLIYFPCLSFRSLTLYSFERKLGWQISHLCGPVKNLWLWRLGQRQLQMLCLLQVVHYFLIACLHAGLQARDISIHPRNLPQWALGSSFYWVPSGLL